LERYIRRRGAYSLYWDLNAFALKRWSLSIDT
jgi:hypothetical protein